MTDLKTKQSTLEALEAAARRPLTPEEIRKQRVSFVMGSLDADSSITREKVEKILAEMRGEAA
jgi:Ca2+-binding EF-hand superfamily protein